MKPIYILILSLSAFVAVSCTQMGKSNKSTSKSTKGETPAAEGELVESTTLSEREIAQYLEETREGKVVTKVFEEQKNGLHIIRVVVVKDGKVTESVHNFNSPDFSISVPISAHIVEDAEVANNSDTSIKVTQFSQFLEGARDSMLKADYVGALESLNKALQIDSYNPQAHMMKGSIFYAMGKLDLARKEFDYVLKLDPGNQEVKQFREFMETKPTGAIDSPYKELEGK